MQRKQSRYSKALLAVNHIQLFQFFNLFLSNIPILYSLKTPRELTPCKISRICRCRFKKKKLLVLNNKSFLYKSVKFYTECIWNSCVTAAYFFKKYVHETTALVCLWWNWEKLTIVDKKFCTSALKIRFFNINI